MEKVKSDFNVNSSFVSKVILLIYRFGNYCHYNVRIPILRQILKIVYFVLDFFIVKGFGGCEIPARCKIGKGLKLPHPRGIIIHHDAVIGDDVSILHEVTLGVNSDPNQVPIIHNKVFIGAGAKIMGGIHLGENSKIGANAVVLKDVPANSTAVGIPAKIIRELKISKPAL